MNVNLYVLKDYRKKMISQSKKTNPIQTQFQKPITALKEWQENKAVMTAHRRHEYNGPERLGTRSLDGYTRSTATCISRRARDQLFPSVQPHALAVATFIAVPSAEAASDLSLIPLEADDLLLTGLRPFKKPANRKSPQPTVDNTLPRPIHRPCQAPFFVTTTPPFCRADNCIARFK